MKRVRMRGEPDTPELTLVEPRADLRDSYRGLVVEFVRAGEPLVPFPLAFPNEDFTVFLEGLAACERGEGEAEGWVPHSTYWLVRGGTDVLGVSNLRHRLTDRLRREGGHIGYGIRPSERGKGYARRLLALTLDRARSRGLRRVLLTCAGTNVRSVRTIRANGGVLESEELVPEREDMVVRRYWIDLVARREDGAMERKTSEGGCSPDISA